MADIFKLPKLIPTPTGILQQSLVGAVSSSSSPGPSSPDAGKVVLLDVNGQLDTSFISGGGSTAFSAITGSTNTTAAMVVGSGASINYTGTGIVNASQTNGITITNTPTHAGMLLISQPGNTTQAYADPQVQGLYAAGSVLSPAPVYVAPTDIQPVLIGGSDGTRLRNISTDSSGNVNVNVVSGGGSSNVTIVNPLGS